MSAFYRVDHTTIESCAVLKADKYRVRKELADPIDVARRALRSLSFVVLVLGVVDGISSDVFYFHYNVGGGLRN